jgi:2-C-methyl-D-erythritol 4-phosphate cytidylyltransferase/2-C-methyl-D-erythritol 2,4-cyclodiphosphate synthase
MQSVAAGLSALSSSDAKVLAVHDAARPFVTTSLLHAGYQMALEKGAAVPTLPLHEACVRVASGDLRMEQAVDREGLVRVQTPQFFKADVLRDAFARASHTAYVDESSLLLDVQQPVTTFLGERNNIKLTTPEDFLWAEQWLESMMTTITTYGYDVHRTQPGDHVWLAGLRLPAPFSLEGHSDADVVLHALTDALLGAVGDGDIGVHFPPTDNQWRGADSHQFVSFARGKLAAHGGQLVHVDVTLIAEAPKIGPYRQEMQARLAELCGLSVQRVGLKATTAEKLGALGRTEGVAAHVVVTTRVPL